MAKTITQGSITLGANRLFPPTLDLSREPSFSGVGETFGDQYLSREAGSIRGPQKNGLAATVKYFTRFGTPEQVLNTAVGGVWPREGDKEDAFTDL